MIGWPGTASRDGRSAIANFESRIRTSSPATPDGLFEETIDASNCPHISNLLSDAAESEPVLKTFRRAVAWKAQRTHDALHSTKRRKVRCSLGTPAA